MSEPTDDPRPETAADALARARTHARRAVGEALRAARALVDAAALGMTGRPSDATAALAGIARALDDQAARFESSEASIPASVMKSVLEALDQEISRWERRAASDPDARAVLRTFLGLREILWEFGLRAEPRTEPQSPEADAPPKRPARRRRKTSGKATAPGRPGRVQRVDVKG